MALTADGQNLSLILPLQFFHKEIPSIGKICLNFARRLENGAASSQKWENRESRSILCR